MAKGTDYQVIIWVVIMVLWGLGKFLSNMFRNAKEKANPPLGQQTATSPIMQNLTKLIEQQAQQPHESELLFAEQEEEEPPPPPVWKQRKRRVPRASIFDEAETEYNTAQTGSHFGSFNATLRTTSAALRMPASSIPSMSSAAISTKHNPLRPVWKNSDDVKKAILAAVVLQRPQI